METNKKPSEKNNNSHKYIEMCFPRSDRTNKESVRAIQKSVFTVCLDAPMPRVSDELYKSRVAAQMLHGGGARWNSGNRWFDKTIQVRKPDAKHVNVDVAL